MPVDIVERIAGMTVEWSYDHNASTGAKGRKWDNTRIPGYFGLELPVRLPDGVEKTCRSNYGEMLHIRFQPGRPVPASGILRR